MAALPHKRRVRVGTDLPRVPPPRSTRVPVVTLGLLAWLVAVLAGAALMDPQGASQWASWARARAEGVLSAAAGSAVAPPASSESTARAGAGGAASGTSLVVREQASGGAGGTRPKPAPLTCEGAIRAYREKMIAGAGKPEPVTENRHLAELNRASYFQQCEVSDEVRVDVCAAIQSGHVVGVTVQTTPDTPLVERCVGDAVRMLEIDTEPRSALDVTNVRFEAQWRAGD